jgi:hypothetical protein
MSAGERDTGDLRDDPPGGGGEGGGLPRLLAVLELLTEAELVELNHRVVQRLRLMQEIRAHGSMMNFRIGQRVWFNTAAGDVVRGTLAKYNRKSVTVVTEDGHQWRVSPALLQSG